MHNQSWTEKSGHSSVQSCSRSLAAAFATIPSALLRPPLLRPTARGLSPVLISRRAPLGFLIVYRLDSFRYRALGESIEKQRTLSTESAVFIFFLFDMKDEFSTSPTSGRKSWNGYLIFAIAADGLETIDRLPAPLRPSGEARSTFSVAVSPFRRVGKRAKNDAVGGESHHTGRPSSQCQKFCRRRAVKVVKVAATAPNFLASAATLTGRGTTHLRRRLHFIALHPSRGRIVSISRPDSRRAIFPTDGSTDRSMTCNQAKRAALTCAVGFRL